MKELERTKLPNEDGAGRRAGGRDKENLERGVMGFERHFNISTYGYQDCVQACR